MAEAAAGCSGMVMAVSSGGSRQDARYFKTISLVSVSPKSKSSIVKAKDARCIRQLRQVRLEERAPLLAPKRLAAEAHTHEEEEMDQTPTLQSLRKRLTNLEAEFLTAEADAAEVCAASTSSSATDDSGGGRGAGCSQGFVPAHSEKEIEEAVETLQGLRKRLLSLKAEITQDQDPGSSGGATPGGGSHSPPAPHHTNTTTPSPTRAHPGSHQHCCEAPSTPSRPRQGALGYHTDSPLAWLDRSPRPDDVFWNWNEQ